MITTIHQASELSSSFLDTCKDRAGDVLVLIIEFVDAVELELVSGRLVVRRPAMGEGLGSKVGESDSADIPAEVEVVSGTLVVRLDSLVVSSGLVVPVEDPVVSASFVVKSDGKRQTGALESSNNVHTPPLLQSFSQLFPS